MNALVWFRTDLRSIDNLALHAACRDASRGVIALFVVSPGEWRNHDAAPIRVDFWLRSLRELARELRALNIPLIVEVAPNLKDVPATVAGVAARNSCDALYFNHEYEINERARDDRIRQRLEETGVRVHAFHDQVYAPPGEVRTGEGRFFTVFTPFKKASYAFMLRQGMPEPKPRPAKRAAMPPASASPTGRVIDETDLAPSPSAPAAENHILSAAEHGFHLPATLIKPAHELWPAGERHAASQLASFIEHRIKPYKAERDFPARPGTSMLSAALNIGTISCRQCLNAAVDANAAAGSKSPLDAGNEGIVHWISELLWREFYIHIMVGYPRVCMRRAFQPATEAIRWSDNRAHFDAWTQGRTGVPIVDAGMRQLLATGWMHNRVRMIVAMYLTKNLFLNWQLGEKHFMLNLVDGFLASNNGGWQWSASTGTDAAPYFRVFNPVSQSQKFDADGSYIRTYVPELAGVQGEAIHEPWTIPALLRAKLDYPEPLVDLSASRLRAIDAFRELKAAQG
jgi:deoxyribodipyrimidine photo-lyase